MSSMDELSVQDYIEICKEAGNYKQAIFWCDIASAQESEDAGNDVNVENDSIADTFELYDENVKIPQVRGTKSVEYLLEMAALYMLDGKEVCVESVLKRINPDDLQRVDKNTNDENISGFSENKARQYSTELSEGFNQIKLMDNMEEDAIMENEANSLLSKKLFLEAQYLYSVHRYEECLSLIESSIDLSNFDTFVSSSIHTMAADSFSSIGNIEYATMLYETALYESHHAVEALDYLLELPYCSDSTKQALLANIIGSPIGEVDKAWIRNYLHPFQNVEKNSSENGASIFRSASPSISPNRRKEKRLLPTSPINVASRISVDNPDKIAFRNNYIEASENKMIQDDLMILDNIARGAKGEIGLRLAAIYMYRFICQSNLVCGYILGCNIWVQLFRKEEESNEKYYYNFGDPLPAVFNDSYKSFKYSTAAFCEFINMFSLCIVCKLYTEISICQASTPNDLNDYITLLECFIVVLDHYGGNLETIKKTSKDGSLTFSTQLFNSKLFGKNSDDICCGINFNGNNLGNDLNYGNDNNATTSTNSWYKKLFPNNISVSSFFFVKACFLFVSAIGRVHSHSENSIQTVRSLLRTSMYFLKRSINFNYIMLPSYYLWGNIYSILGQWDDAVVIFRRIIRLFPSTNLSITSATSLLLQRVQIEKDLRIADLLNQCVGWASKGLQINKDTPSIHNSLGICAYYEKKYDIAIGYFQKAFNCLSSQNQDGAENIPINNSFSTSIFNKTLFKNPGTPNFNSSLFSFNPLPFIISINLALSYLMGGHYQNAIDSLSVLFTSKKYFHHALFDPTFLQYIYITLGISYHLLDNTKEACNYYELFLSLPTDDEILDELEEYPNTETMNSIKIPGNDSIQMIISGDQNKYLSKVFIKSISELYNSLMQSIL
ncbi:Tetratricopeptide repeat family protein [Cryptosporidium meleagridis]|uniref:Tetratricopeptide repeat family protein n=1 Tax=Cryptosporidium meleagridis TaxID=93969 RepID=A0A2P4Z0N0_9CRYT|nr:Tetratricopeptide repeat family protein [Cryptosporidium meleagridis]